jgi:hypothetical protein
METVRKVNVTKHSNSRPNSLAYKLSLPSWVVDVLELNVDDREVKVKLVDGKIIIEKV